MPQANRVRYYRDSVSIVTGAASGIGRALAEALAADGGRLVLLDMQDDPLAAVAATLKDAGADVATRRVDVRDAVDIKAAVDDTVSRFGRLDFVFNNAGIVIEGGVEDHTLEDWVRIVDINLRGVVHGVHAAYPPMRDQRFGHIVNTASLAGLIPVPRLAGYTATKHAVVGLTRVVRAEGASYGVRATALCPGRVRTPILTGGKFGRVTDETRTRLQQEAAQVRGALEPNEFARRVLRGLRRNKALIVEPRAVRAVAALDRHFPRTFNWIARRAASNVQAKIRHQ